MPHTSAFAFLKRPSALARQSASRTSAQLQQRTHPAERGRRSFPSPCRPVQPDGHRRDAEPEAHLHLPALAPAEEPAAPARFVVHARPPRVSAAGDDARCRRSSRLLPEGRADGGFEPGSRWRCAPCSSSPAVPVPRRAQPAADDRPAGRPVPTGRAISSWRRGCRSSSGAAFPTTSCSTAAARGKLAGPAVLERQVRRMLADRALDALVDQLRRTVAVSAQPASRASRTPTVSRLRRQPPAGVPARDRAVLREHRARGPQRPRPADAPTTRF